MCERPFKRTFLILLLLFPFTGFTLAKAQAPVGISGMAPADLANPDESAFLVVHDAQNRGQEPAPARFGIVAISVGNNAEYRTVEEDWSRVSELGNDLEAICALPETRNEFLAVESGYFAGRYGRILHAALIRSESGAWTVQVRKATKLPADVKSIEGLGAVAGPDGRVLLIIGERTGVFTPLALRWDWLDVANWPRSLAFADGREYRVPLADGFTRDVADLYVDERGRLWTAACVDLGDSGPFHSAIYLAGRVDPGAGVPVYVTDAPQKVWELSGFKVEAISRPVIRSSLMSIGTDDERYGGTWRPLFRP